MRTLLLIVVVVAVLAYTGIINASSVGQSIGKILKGVFTETVTMVKSAADTAKQ